MKMVKRLLGIGVALCWIVQVLLLHSLSKDNKIEAKNHSVTAVNVTETTVGHKIPFRIDPLPRWPLGIDWRAFEAYWEMWRKMPYVNRDLLNPMDRFPVGNTVYILQRHQLMVSRSAHETQRLLYDRRMKYTEYLLKEALKRVNSGQWPQLYAALEGGLPLLINYNDYRHCSKDNLQWKDATYSVPVFAYCASASAESCNHTWALPSQVMIRNALLSEKSQRNSIPWDKKINQVVWRGSASTPPGVSPSSTIRQRLVQMSSSWKWMDVAFSPCRRKQCPELLRRPFVDNFGSYRAVLDMDGISWSERFPTLLCETNSVVLKMEPQFIDYFAPALEPFVHYVPVTFQTLFNTSQWILKNEGVARAIAERAREYCLHHWNFEGLIRDSLDILEVYASKFFQLNPDWLLNWERVNTLDPIFEWETVNGSLSLQS